MVNISTNTKNSVNVSTRGGGSVNVNSNIKGDVNADTNGNSQRAKSWAVGVGLIDNEDYSAKYYAQQAKQSEEIASGAIIGIDAVKDAAIEEMEEAKDEKIAEINATASDFEDDLTALTERAETAATSAETAATSAEVSAASAASSAEYIVNHAPTVTVTQTATGATITAVDMQGTTTANITNGADGQDGVAATITLGSVNTGAAGSNVIITNSGTSSAAVFNFTIPKGDKGDTGAQGIQGEKGDKGDKGDTGAQGPQGVKGNTGATGTDGFSPIATVSKSGNKATITITDKNGTTTADVYDGSGGGGGTVDQTYDATSANAQSGVAINGARFLRNNVTNSHALSILGEQNSNIYCISLGIDSNAKNYGIGIGYKAIANDNYAIQLGRGTNSTANTLSVGLSSSTNYQLLDSSGIIPDARLSNNIARTSDIPSLTGYATETWVGQQGYITGITSSDVTTALGYTPYNSTNPDGYITSSALTNYVTTDTAQDITAKKTFVGDKAILFKQATTADKLGFTLYNTSNAELAAFEFRPSTIGSSALFNLNLSKTSANYVGFRYHGTNAINIAAPKVATAGNYYIPINFTDGTNTVTANNVGTVNISTLLPTVPTKTSDLTNDSGYITSSALSGYATETYVNTGLATKQNTISDLATIRSNANSAIQPDTLNSAMNNKEDMFDQVKAPLMVTYTNGLVDFNGSDCYVTSDGILTGDTEWCTVNVSADGTDIINDYWEWHGSFKYSSISTDIPLIGLWTAAGGFALDINSSGEVYSEDDTSNILATVAADTWISFKFVHQANSNTVEVTLLNSQGVLETNSSPIDQSTTGTITDFNWRVDTTAGVEFDLSSPVCYYSLIPNGVHNTFLNRNLEVDKYAFDGQWIDTSSSSIISSSTSLVGTTQLQYSIASIIPNDGYNYEVMFVCEGTTGATSGHMVTLRISSDICGGGDFCRAQTRTSSAVVCGGTMILPVSTSRKIYIHRNNNWNGSITNLWISGYRRLGTNT